MLEEVAEMFMGPWGIAAAVLVGASTTGVGRRVFRHIAKASVRVGYEVSDRSSAAFGAAKEQLSGAASGAREQLFDVVSEAKADRSEGTKKSPKQAKRKESGEFDVEFS